MTATLGVGAVAVSVYGCPNRLTRWRLERLHRKVEDRIADEVGAHLVAIMNAKLDHVTHLSVSLWSSMESVADIKTSKQHVAMMHWARIQGVMVNVWIYEFRGDWRRALAISG